MLTESRVKKVLDLVKKEYDYMDNKPIDILVERLGKWCTETNINSYTLILDKKFNDDDFSKFFYVYLAEEFKFDLTWARVDYENTMTALVLLHEIGHIQQTMNIELTKGWAKKVNKTYNDFKIKSATMSEMEQLIAYRLISYEYLADKFAVEIFSKYAVKILTILNGTSQKEIKNRLEEVNKKVA